MPSCTFCFLEMFNSFALKDYGLLMLHLIDCSRCRIALHTSYFCFIQFGSLAGKDSAQVFRLHPEWVFGSKWVPVQILQHHSDGGRGEFVFERVCSESLNNCGMFGCSFESWGVIVFLSADGEQIQFSVKTIRDWEEIWSEKRADGGQQGPAGLWLQIMFAYQQRSSLTKALISHQDYMRLDKDTMTGRSLCLTSPSAHKKKTVRVTAFPPLSLAPLSSGSVSLFVLTLSVDG